MNEQESGFLKLSLEYKRKYEETSWWKFRKRKYYKSMWYSARECLWRYGVLKERKL